MRARPEPDLNQINEVRVSVPVRCRLRSFIRKWSEAKQEMTLNAPLIRTLSFPNLLRTGSDEKPSAYQQQTKVFLFRCGKALHQQQQQQQCGGQKPSVASRCWIRISGRRQEVQVLSEMKSRP
ncbi:uncharacterized protein V6R79_017569 [Siganus canaliculatus]